MFFSEIGIPNLVSYFADQAINMDIMLKWKNPARNLKSLGTCFFFFFFATFIYIIGITQEGVIARVVQALIEEKQRRGIQSSTTVAYFPSVFDGNGADLSELGNNFSRQQFFSFVVDSYSLGRLISSHAERLLMMARDGPVVSKLIQLSSTVQLEDGSEFTFNFSVDPLLESELYGL